jgi:hypothetical protein
VPESRVSRRSTSERSAPAPESGTFALRVLSTLPQAHQGFVFREIGGLCRHYLRSKPEDASEISCEELVRGKWARVFMVLQMIVIVVAAAWSNIGSMVCPDKLKDVVRGILDEAHSPSESLC